MLIPVGSFDLQASQLKGLPALDNLLQWGMRNVSWQHKYEQFWLLPCLQWMPWITYCNEAHIMCIGNMNTGKSDSAFQKKRDHLPCSVRWCNGESIVLGIPRAARRQPKLFQNFAEEPVFNTSQTNWKKKYIYITPSSVQWCICQSNI